MAVLIENQNQIDRCVLRAETCSGGLRTSRGNVLGGSSHERVLRAGDVFRKLQRSLQHPELSNSVPKLQLLHILEVELLGREVEHV